jgi:hypothetical protein
LGFKNSITKRKVRRHFKLKWIKLQHKNVGVPENLKNKEKQQVIISTKNIDAKQLRYVIKPECIVDKDDKTLVHLEELDDFNAVIKATDAVTSYYFHMVSQPNHRSKSFWKDLTEHFGAYVDYSMLPYTSSDTANSHNIEEHQECVNNLLYALQPLSNSVNKFVNEYYEHYFMKLNKLNWGPFAPKPFGIFPMIAINFNIISNYHWDEKDEPNGLCFLVALGDFEGGELHFPQLQIVVKLRPGQVVAFPSHLLLHGNFKVIKGIRFSIVYFVHMLFFHQYRHFEKIYDEYNSEKLAGIVRPLEDLYSAPQKEIKNSKKSKKPKKFQVNEEEPTDQRRNNIGKYFFKKNMAII